MNTREFSALLQRLMAAAQAGDGHAFAECFTPDGVYHDYIYGDHTGRAQIEHMISELFHRDAQDYRWEMFDPVCDGDIGLRLVALGFHFEGSGVRREAVLSTG